MDTTVGKNNSVSFNLQPTSFELEEFVVEANPISYSTVVGQQASVIRINNRIANFLPGNSDNAVFTLMKLHPGVTASGEQTSELNIRGSYPGHSKLTYDGFTIFGLNNFKDNISPINPLLAKDISITKSNQDAEYGNIIGGLVKITGIEGNKRRNAYEICIDNMTFNGVVSVPIKDNSSLLFSTRQTYYNLYHDENVDKFKNANNSTINSIEIHPKYNFSDYNLKYSAKTSQGDHYYISSMFSNDRYSYNVQDEDPRKIFVLSNKQTNRQYGVSGVYNLAWKNGNTTKLNISNSGKKFHYSDNNSVKSKRLNLGTKKIRTIANSIYELKSQVVHNFNINKHYSLKIGVDLNYNWLRFNEDTVNTNLINLEENVQTTTGFVHSNFNLTNKLSFGAGTRFEYYSGTETVYFQPRFRVLYNLNEFINFNFSYGLHNQFVSKHSLIDESGNVINFWKSSDGVNYKVLSSNQFSTAISFIYDGLVLNFEPYYSTIGEVTKVVKDKRTTKYTQYIGDSKSFGIDLYAKKTFDKHYLMLGYSFSNVQERFDELRKGNYFPAPQNQKHEIKAVGLYSLNPFFISANYIFGSGFPNSKNYKSEDDSVEKQYSRFDIAFTYKLNWNKIDFETGVSILNLFNTENIRYQNNIEYANGNGKIQLKAESTPFTPLMFFKMKF
jgi:hypothetical protein